MAMPPADFTASATRRSSVATTAGPTPAALARRQTRTIIGSPLMSASGLPGKRVDAMRAGMRTTGLTTCFGGNRRRRRAYTCCQGRRKAAKQRCAKGGGSPNLFQRRRKQSPSMHLTEFNRVALTALGSVLFAMLLVAFSNLIFSPINPLKPGYPLPTGGTEQAATAAAPGPARPRRRQEGRTGRACLHDLPQFRKGGRPENRSAALGRRRSSGRFDRGLLLLRFAQGRRRRLELPIT